MDRVARTVSSIRNSLGTGLWTRLTHNAGDMHCVERWIALSENRIRLEELIDRTSRIFYEHIKQTGKKYLEKLARL